MFFETKIKLPKDCMLEDKDIINSYTDAIINNPTDYLKESVGLLYQNLLSANDAASISKTARLRKEDHDTAKIYPPYHRYINVLIIIPINNSIVIKTIKNTDFIEQADRTVDEMLSKFNEKFEMNIDISKIERSPMTEKIASYESYMTIKKVFSHIDKYLVPDIYVCSKLIFNSVYNADSDTPKNDDNFYMEISIPNDKINDMNNIDDKVLAFVKTLTYKPKFMPQPFIYLINSKYGSNSQKYYLINSLYDNNMILSKRYVEAYVQENYIDDREALGGVVVLRCYSDDKNKNDNGNKPAYSLNNNTKFGRRESNGVESFFKSFKNDRTEIAVQYNCIVEVRYDDANTLKILEKVFGKNRIVDLRDQVTNESYIKTIKNTLNDSYHFVASENDIAMYLEKGKKYYGDELSSIASNIYYDKVIYPEYAVEMDEISSLSIKDEKKPMELNKMVGLKDAKDLITSYLNLNKLQKEYEKRGLKVQPVTKHLVFTGDPGTAKTTIARTLTSILYKNGCIKNDKLVEVSRQDLVGKYVGWTADQTKTKIEEAKGGVMFVDEAYSLVDNENGGFGKEAIDAIVYNMENVKDDTIFIFAGYKKEMNEFIATVNPGLRSRIGFSINFENYTIDELSKIMKNMVADKGLVITDKAIEKAKQIFAKYIHNRDFGNGRFVRSLLEKSIFKQSNRLAEVLDSVSDKDIITITEDDVYDFGYYDYKDSKKIGFDRG